MSGLFAKLSHVLKDPLYKDSLFMVLSRLLNATAGFLFWVIAAKFYSINEVGTATALISSLGLVMLFSRFGFDLSIIRYIANTDKNKVFNTSLVITTIAAAVIGLLYMILVSFFQVDLALNLIYGMLFIPIALFNSITLITGNMFLALRKGQYFLIQTILISLRLFLLLPFAHFKSYGILLALGTCYIFSSIFSLWVLRKNVKINFFEIDRLFVKKSFKFSVGSYISNILIEAPILIMPIMVLHLIGQEAAAQYYIAMAIGNLSLIIPYSLSYSLFIEGSYGKSIKENIIKACSTAYLFLIPITAVIGLWGKNILQLIDIKYVDAYNLLFMVIVTSFFAVAYLIFNSVQNVKMQVKRNIKFNLFRFLILLGASFYLIPKYSINGVGYAWLLTHIILVLLIPSALIKKGLMKVWGQVKAGPIKADNTPKQIILTTGPVIRDSDAKSLVVVVFNTTNLSLEVKVVVNDLKAGRKNARAEILQIQSNVTKTLTFPQPPALYEVFIEGIYPGVYIWTSTSKKHCGSCLQDNKFIGSNTFRHKDFINVSDT